MIILSATILLGIFIINITFGLYYGFGIRHYWFFELEHFIGGFFIAMFLANFTSSGLTIIIGLLAISILWELTEYMIAHIDRLSRQIKKTFHQKATFELKDTLLDLFLDLTGAILFIYLFK